MIAFLLAVLMGLTINIATGSLAFLLWNHGPARFLPVTEIDWLTGVASFLLIRLIVSPPKLKFNLEHQI